MLNYMMLQEVTKFSGKSLGCEGVPAKQSVVEIFTVILSILNIHYVFEKVPWKYLFLKYFIRNIYFWKPRLSQLCRFQKEEKNRRF